MLCVLEPCATSKQQWGTAPHCRFWMWGCPCGLMFKYYMAEIRFFAMCVNSKPMPGPEPCAVSEQ
jgi:hypothetical protein